MGPLPLRHSMICTVIYSNSYMALKIDDCDANIKRKTIISFAKPYGISEKAIHSALDKLLLQFSKNVSSLCSIPMDEKKKEFLNTMILSRQSDLQC
ncbi:MAG: hypothetical protein PSV35_00850 [bacterium]|nr:hypothetical protein [bacterium]